MHVSNSNKEIASFLGEQIAVQSDESFRIFRRRGWILFAPIPVGEHDAQLQHGEWMTLRDGLTKTTNSLKVRLDDTDSTLE